jgi:hypothetical protein
MLGHILKIYSSTNPDDFIVCCTAGDPYYKITALKYNFKSRSKEKDYNFTSEFMILFKKYNLDTITMDIIKTEEYKNYNAMINKKYEYIFDIEK